MITAETRSDYDKRNQKKAGRAFKQEPFPGGGKRIHRPSGKTGLDLYESQTGWKPAFQGRSGEDSGRGNGH